MSVSQEFIQDKKWPTQTISNIFQGWYRKHKTHCFQESNMGLDFILEESPKNPGEFYMTACKSGIRQNDFIKIQDVSSTVTYKILRIDYYSGLQEMWIAKLAEAK